ncbi:hypothetical protein QQF64_025484 [Cirrhinus molitorella]|uniref:Uncharacterized protein n=1 Tax=Cirrhinus molitorella TaxID=172907 RepID=A0ABR3NQB9_9TELE
MISRERRGWVINYTGIATSAQDLCLSLALLQIDFSSSAQSVTGIGLKMDIRSEPRLSRVWQCVVLVRRGRPKVRGCAGGTCASGLSGFISYLPACVLPCCQAE